MGEINSTAEQLERDAAALIGLCFERGFATLDPPLLCARTGISTEDFASRYADLEDCFCQTLEYLRDDFFAYLDRALFLADPRRWVDRLRAVAYGLLRYLRADRARAHFLIIELHLAGERATLIWTETILAPLLARIDEGRRLAPDPAGLSPRTAAAIGGAVFTRIHRAAEDGSLYANEDPVPELMYLAVLPYLGPQAAASELSAPPPPDPALLD